MTHDFNIFCRFTVCVAVVTGVWYQKVQNVAIFTNILDTIPAKSAKQCGMTCVSFPGCHGFDFNKEEKECVLHDAVVAPPNNPSINRTDEIHQSFGNLKSIYFT